MSLRKALKQLFQKGKSWNNKGTALHKLGKYEEAIECYEKALEIDPKFVKAWNNKGLALNGLGKYEEAIECYEKALEIDPEYTYAKENLEILKNSHPKIVPLMEAKKYIRRCSRIYEEVSFEKVLIHTNDSGGIKITRQDLITESETMIINKQLHARLKEDKIIFMTEQSRPRSKEETEEEKVEIYRGGAWKIGGGQSIFHFKVKIRNNSPHVITNINILLTSIPEGLKTNKKLRTINTLDPKAYISPTFKFIATDDCVGSTIEGQVQYKTFEGERKTVHLRPLEIRYVCNLLEAKKVSELEYEKNTVLMENLRKDYMCKGDLEGVAQFMKNLLDKNNFYTLSDSFPNQPSDFVKIRGYAKGKYDHEDVAIQIALQRKDENTHLILKSMSKKIDKLYDINREISSKCDEIKTDTEIITEYMPLIKDIFQDVKRLEEIENYMKEHLATDWEKLKNAWEEYKTKKISLKEFLKETVKVAGKRALKLLSKLAL